LNINLAYQANDRKEYEPLPNKGKELAFGLKLTTMTYDLKWTSNPEKNSGSWSARKVSSRKMKNYGLESLVPDAPHISDIGGYALLRYDLSKINVLAGSVTDSRFLELESYEPANEENEPSHTIGTEPEIEKEFDFSPINGSLDLHTIQ
jgi:hypothetical protein